MGRECFRIAEPFSGVRGVNSRESPPLVFVGSGAPGADGVKSNPGLCGSESSWKMELKFILVSPIFLSSTHTSGLDNVPGEGE